MFAKTFVLKEKRFNYRDETKRTTGTDLEDSPKMKKIAIVVHLFYPEHYAELAGCLRNITEPHDLFMTIRNDQPGDLLCNTVQQDFPEARISRPSNVGYDIWPFFSVFNELDLASYDYIVKLHTKRDFDGHGQINYYDISGKKWRRRLLSFVSSRNAWRASLSQIEKPNVGIVGALECILRNVNQPVDKKAVELAARILNKNMGRRCRYRYVGGTMFLVKTSCIAALQGVFSERDFEMADEMHHRESTSHQVERLFGVCAYSENKSVIPFCRFGALRLGIHIVLSKIARLFYHRKISYDGWLTIRVLRIPIVRKMVDESLGYRPQESGG